MGDDARVASGALPLELRPVAGGVRLGVEHEYQVWAGREVRDFRRLLPEVTSDLRRLDSGDPRACRLPSGVALTADGREAELATPPLPAGHDVAARLDRLLARERANLADALAEVGVDRLTGFSTHVNVSVPDDLVVDVAQRFARHCGAVAFLVCEPRVSQGLLVRPRRGRLEVGGEYAEGGHLVSAVTFVASAAAALLGGPAGPPDPLPIVVERSREKFGWFLPPSGPVAGLLRGGRSIDAVRLLERTWDWARPACVDLGLDPSPLDDLVAGGPWRTESEEAPDTCTVGPAGDPPPTPRSVSTGSRELPGGITAETVWLTWSHVVWGFFAGSRSLYAVLAAEQEEEFLTALDAGRYHGLIQRELTRPSRPRRLMAHIQLDGAGWWHEVRPGALVPAERRPDGTVPRVGYRRGLRAHRRAARSTS